MNKKGKIAVIAPAESLKKVSENRIFAQSRIEKELNMKVIYGKSSMKAGLLNSASIKERVTDLHSAFLNNDVEIILCAKGGYNSNELLEYIDWDIIKNNSKPIIGLSDITVLLNAIYAKTKIITYLGPTFIDFAEKKGFEYSLEYFKKALFLKEFSIEQSNEWTNDSFFRNQDNKTYIKNEGPLILQKGKAVGRIVGGNLCSLNLLQGTNYMPPLKDHILFIEDDDLAGESFFGEFNRNLTSLLQTKDAKKIKALIIGRNQPTSHMDIIKSKYAFLTKMLSKSIPIIIDVDFGHTTPRITLPIGGTAEITATSTTAKIVIKK